MGLFHKRGCLASGYDAGEQVVWIGAGFGSDRQGDLHFAAHAQGCALYTV
jgi:hypothetical protein